MRERSTVGRPTNGHRIAWNLTSWLSLVLFPIAGVAITIRFLKLTRWLLLAFAGFVFQFVVWVLLAASEYEVYGLTEFADFLAIGRVGAHRGEAPFSVLGLGWLLTLAGLGFALKEWERQQLLQLANRSETTLSKPKEPPT